MTDFIPYRRSQSPESDLAAELHPYANMQQSRGNFSICTYRPRPFVDLPQEIVRLIVERAAAICPQTGLNLTLVSKAVRAWAEPSLYHTIALRSSHAVELFRVAFNAKPHSFFANHVNTLCIHGERGTDIILACSSLQRLAAYPPALEDLPNIENEEEKYTTLPSIQSLAASPLVACTGCPTPSEVMLTGCLDDVPWASPLFHQTKFLYICLEHPTPATACDISLLPSLTHCAFPYDYDRDEEDALLLTITTLLESTTLKYLILLVHDELGNPDRERKGPIWSRLACITDLRLLVGTEHTFDVDDWLTAANYGIGMWDFWVQECKYWRNGL